MAYLKIENRVNHIPSVELMRMLGATTSRGNEDQIGQFGSGTMHSLAVFANFGILESAKLCNGLDVYTWYLQDHAVKDSHGNRSVQSEICMKKQNGGTWNLNTTPDFGAMDWTSLRYAVREIISNAIDGARSFDGTTNSVVIEKIDSDESRMLRAKDGCIRFYIKLTEEIDDYINELHTNFLCLSPGYNPKVKVFQNTDLDQGPARVYRKGVMVGTFGEKSLFHYNIDDIEIKESRNVDSYAAEKACARAIAGSTNPAIIARFLNAKLTGEQVWEQEFNSWYLNPEYCSEDAQNTWAKASRTTFKDTVICTSDVTTRIVEAKGFKTTRKIDSSLTDILKKYDVKTDNDILNHHELAGKEILPANDNVVNRLCDVWGFLEEIQVTYGKEIPQIGLFAQNSVEGGALGYYPMTGDTIYIRSDIQDDRGAQLFQTILEECGHYITGAMDYTRDIQEWLGKVATNAVLKHIL